MASVTEITDADLNNWIPGSRFFATSDGQYFIVDSDLTEYPEGKNTFIRRPTLIFYCNPDATVTDMTPDHTFDPGTTAEEAIEELGYTLQSAS